MLALDADDDAVGPLEILDRRALAQELGIGGDLEVEGRAGRRECGGATARVVPTGTVDLQTTTAPSAITLGDVVGCAEHLAEVGTARRRAASACPRR